MKLKLFIISFLLFLSASAQRNTDGNTLVTRDEIATTFSKSAIYFTDFITSSTTANQPFVGAAISTGTSAANTANMTGNNPGVIRLSSSTTANSGYRWITDGGTIRLHGSEWFECYIAPVSFTTTTFRAGFLDNTTSTDATDGVYFEFSTNGNLVLKTSNNTVRTTSATITTLSLNTWYKLFVQLNPAGTSATGYAYNAAGVLLGSATINTNIPTAASRETGMGLICTNSGTTATALIDIDYISASLKISR